MVLLRSLVPDKLTCDLFIIISDKEISLRSGRSSVRLCDAQDFGFVANGGGGGGAVNFWTRSRHFLPPLFQRVEVGWIDGAAGDTAHKMREADQKETDQEQGRYDREKS